MKILHILVVAAATAAFATFLLVPLWVSSHVTNVVSHETTYVTQPKLSPAQLIWMARLMQCESGLKAGSINPNDLDNTPSYGLLQFKPSTFAQAARQYKLASTTDYMNPESQVAILEHWVLDGGVRWSQQFPGCVQKLGVPPKTGVL